MILRSSGLLFLGGAMFTSNAFAEVLDTVFVSSSRIEKESAREEVIRLGPYPSFELESVLNQQPGIVAFANGGLGGSTYLSLRGGEPNFTLILVDDIPVNDPSNSAGGAFDLGQLDPAIISQIKVDRMGASPVHGAGALSGAIRFETLPLNKGQPSGLSFSSMVNSQNGWGGSVALKETWRSGGLLASGAIRDTGKLTGASKSRSDLALLKLEQVIGEGDLRLTGIYSDTTRRAYAEDSGGEPAAQIIGLELRETDLLLLGARFRMPMTQSLSLETRGNLSRQRADAIIPSIPEGALSGVPARKDATEFERWQVSSFVFAQPMHDLDFVFGGELEREHADGRGELDLGFILPTEFERTRTTNSLFAESAYSPLDRLQLKAALRWDDANGFRSRSSQSGTAIFAISNVLRFEASYAESFKLPSIFATDFPLIANPNLKPEESEGAEIGLFYDGEHASLSFIAFQNRYFDLIDFDPELFTNVNRNRVDIDGIEISAAFPIATAIYLQGSVSALDINSFGAPPLRNRPELTGTLRLDWQPSTNWSAFLSWTGAGSSFSSAVPTGTTMLDEYDKFDIGATWTFDDKWQLSLSVSNVTDETYSLAVGVPEPKANAQLAFRKLF